MKCLHYTPIPFDPIVLFLGIEPIDTLVFTCKKQVFVEIVRGCENGKHKVPEAGICLVHFKGKTKAIVSECSNQWREL